MVDQPQGVPPGESPGEPPELPLEVTDFLTWVAVERGRARNTLVAYRRDLRRYLAYLREIGVELGDVSESELVGLDTRMSDAGLAPATRARTLVTVRSLHSFLEREWERPNPAAHLERPQVGWRLPRALPEEQVAVLLDSVPGDTALDRRDRAALELLYGTGIRVSELCGVDVGDLDLDARLLRVLGKGSKERIVPIGAPAVRALEAWLDPDSRVCLVQRGAGRQATSAVFVNARGSRLSRQGVWDMLRRRAREAHITAPLSPHVLRHSCATHMLDHGADIRSVQELLGHESVSTTQLYTMVATDRLRRVYLDAHPRARRGAVGERPPDGPLDGRATETPEPSGETVP